MIDQWNQIFNKINQSTNLKCIVSESDEFRMGIEYGIDKVVDACPEILLQYISLEILIEMQFIFAIDDTFHY